MLSGLVCVQLHQEHWRLKEDCKSASFDTTWLRLVWHFHEMFLLLIGRKSAEKQSYDSFKAYKCIWTESILAFYLYYMYGCVQAIPTYRVYRLYDTIMLKYTVAAKRKRWRFCSVPPHPDGVALFARPFRHNIPRGHLNTPPKIFPGGDFLSNTP